LQIKACKILEFLDVQPESMGHQKTLSRVVSQIFLPEVGSYYEKEGLDRHILLLLDNAPFHPKDLGIDNPCLEVIYMPPFTTSLIQPMDQARYLISEVRLTAIPFP
jgi:hypothetical protein